MNLHPLRGVFRHGSSVADLFAEQAVRQPRVDETPRRPAASPENNLTETYHTVN